MDQSSISEPMLTTALAKAHPLAISKGERSPLCATSSLGEAETYISSPHFTSAGSSPIEGPTFSFLEDEADREAEALGYYISPGKTTLCSFCQYLVDNWPDPQNREAGDDPIWTFSHHEHYESLQATANAGCRLCIQFILSLTDERPTSASHRWPRHRAPLILWNSGVDYLKPEYFFLKLDIPVQKMSVLLALPDHFSASLKMADCTTASMLKRCKSWLSTCAASHPGCIVSEARKPPSRLLYIGGNTIHVCLTSELDKHPQYATLSHCWGTRPFRTLTRGDLEDFRKVIPSEALSKTFQDALRIARNLDMEYIWIDSLCIIQDDEADWARESSLMSSIYGGSTINIAASSAPDGSYGCYLERNKRWGCRVRTVLGTLDCVPEYHQLKNSLSDAPLASRGWVVQERILPVRTLHFTSSEVFWECDTGMASETFPYQLPRFLGFDPPWTTASLDNHAGWAKLVRMYSRCKLSHPKDKLVAISGLAQLVHHKFKDEYIVGLWKSQILHQLCWYRESRHGGRISPYIAPTWSWASVDGGIEWSILSRGADVNRIVLLNILAIETTPTTIDKFGQVSAASLHIRSRLFIPILVHAHFYADTISRDVRLNNGDILVLSLYPDTIQSFKIETQLYLLPSTRTSESLVRIDGLILIRVHTSGEKRYERVGMFEAMQRENTVSSIENFLNPASQVQGWEYGEISAEGDELRTFDITII